MTLTLDPVNTGEPVILDGGLSAWLGMQGHDLDSDLWSARLILENPEAIIRAHLDYLEAGARIITTASYQASIQGLREYGLGHNDARQAMLASVDLAIAARDKFLKNAGDEQVLVAASIGPYGAFLADGSEYRGNYGVSECELTDFHGERLELFASSDADILACETIPDETEVRVLNALLEKMEKPAWISFSCGDQDTIRDGTPVSRVARTFNDHPSVFGVGVNCISPRHAGPLVDTLKVSCPDKTIIVYPNSGETYDASTRTWLESDHAESFAPATKDWHRRGARIIGGCCRVTPEHISRIADTMNLHCTESRS